MIDLNKDHASARHISVTILDQVNRCGSYADDLLVQAFHNSSLKQVDKALVQELVYGTLRWRGQIDWVLQRFFHGSLKTCPGKLKAILEVSLYQLRFLDKIPKYAAVNEGVALAKTLGGNSWGRLVNGVLRNYLRELDSIQFPGVKQDPVNALVIRYSHPKWLVESWLKVFGLKATEALLNYDNRRPAISIRVDLKKAAREQVLSYFGQHGIQVEPSIYFHDFVKISRPHELSNLDWFREGVFTIQDESTAIASLALQPQKADRVLDLCAAPGGKTAHLASLADRSHPIIAVDANIRRLKLLQANLRRLRIDSVRPISADATTFACAPVDKILLDVPCSGLGVLAKRADLRWQRKPQDITRIRKIQEALLLNAAGLLKPNGILVYSTCTIGSAENDTVVQVFLSANPNFRFDPLDLEELTPFRVSDGLWQTFPPEHNMDGAFVARFRKID